MAERRLPLRNLVIGGFMGTGKSTVGRLCAAQLGLPFFDTDAIIEQEEGMPIAEIFARRGEAHFRWLERQLAARLAAQQGAVIATGGGMMMDAEARARLLDNAVGVCLTAAPEVVFARVGGEHAGEARPLLRTSDPLATIRNLLRERASHYAALPYHVDTTALSPEQVADRVCAIYRREWMRIPVNIPRAHAHYAVVLGDGVLDSLGYLVAGRGWHAPFAIVTDDQVGAHYAARAQAALQEVGIQSFVHVMPAGEESKTLAHVEAMYHAFSKQGMERRSAVIALGGGVVGDAAGFAAATFLRGVPFVQVPTSLLAMADASIGGKVGIDMPFGKNLVGAFKQPDLVVADLGMLHTLPAREWRCGMAEIIKAAFIAGGEAYARLRETLLHDGLHPGDLDRLLPLLADAIQLKRAIVQEDPFEEHDKRAWLNLGHTFAHALEAWSQYRLKHGEAVALGLVCALRLSNAMGLCTAQLVEEGIALLRAVGLPTASREVQTLIGNSLFDAEAVHAFMWQDKKRRGGRLRFVLLRAPGDVLLDEAPPALVRQVLEALNHDDV
ncbi:MAG: 3-dehydroquinate synthase [Thermoflexales bacterium]|nr:3-dehydroquinate synthase [Thermoflexales bacterium]MDW8291761.1 3-dehydroquinate synthase [Anaerolineae bacterium]